jgi:geranylgeranyl diphosphate synthase type I
MLAEIEVACQESLNHEILRSEPAIQQMLDYHMGWDPSCPGKKGKRVRPLLLCLVLHACGGDWQRGMAAAVSVELLHNFTLIHDDIQDQSAERHGRPTLWKIHGVPQAINAGDTLFSLALDHLWQLSPAYPAAVIAACSSELTRTCLKLTIGQYRDMDFETRPVTPTSDNSNPGSARQPVTAADYVSMVEGKTTALLQSCCAIGAILAGAKPSTRTAVSAYGYHLGMAFQVIDDYLGIWGNSVLTGKSTASDLVSRKRSIPVIWGLERSPAFRQRWEAGPIEPSDTSQLTEMLDAAGVAGDVLQLANDHTQHAFENLQKIAARGADTTDLVDLTHWLLGRAL